MKRGVATVGLLVAAWACLACGRTAPGQSTQDRFLDSNGVRIRFHVLGQGPPVVLIHGFGESLEIWHQRGVVRALAPHFKVIAMDVRGHGHSGKPHDPKSYGIEMSGDVVRLLRHLGATKAHVVGYSMGALVALDFAVLHQEHTLSVVLGGAGWNPPETLDGFRQQAEAFDKGEVPVREGDDAKALAAMLRGLRVLSEEEVRSIQVPVAALIGTNDRFMTNVRRLSGVLPDLKVMEIPDADHATAPGHPKFAEELLAFLQKQNGATNAISPTAQSVETKQIASGHKEGINTIVFSPDTRRVVTGGNDSTVKLWNIQTGQLEQIFEGHTRAISSLAFSPDGLTLASGSFDQTAKLWDVASKKLKLTVLNSPSGQVKGMSFSPDGKHLAGTGADGVRLWDAGTGKLLLFLPSNRGVLTVAFSPDGKTLAGAGGAGIRLWDTQEGKLLRHLQETESELVTSIAFSPDGQILASGGNRQMVKFWDVSTGSLKSTIDTKEWMRSLAFSFDGRILSGAGRASAQLWDIQTSRLRQVLRSDSSLISVTISPQGKIWAGGATDGTLRLWRFKS